MMKWFVAGLMLLAPLSVAWAKDPPELVVRRGQVVKLAPRSYEFGTVSENAKTKIVLRVAETNALGAGFTVLELTVVNRGGGLIGLSPDMVKVTDPKGVVTSVLSYSDMSKLIDKSFGGQKFRAGLGNLVVAMAAASAGTSTNYGSYSSTTSGRYGSYTTSGTVSTTTYNPYRAAQAQTQAQDFIAANNAALKTRMAEKSDYSKDFSFAPNTIAPGEISSTPVPIQLPKGVTAATVLVTVAGEDHQFEIALLDDPKAKPGVAPPEDLAKWPAAPRWTMPGVDAPAVNSWVSDHIDQKGWTFAGYDDLGVYFADLNTFERLPTGEMRMGMRGEYFEESRALGLSIRSDRSLWELNCNEKKVRVMSFKAYALPNLAGPDIQEEGAAEWFSPSPGSVAESFSAKLCQTPAGLASD